jgi:16S rRNA processing protein RimM
VSPAGSDHPEGVVVGRVLGTHGTSGEVRVRTYSDVPHRFDVGRVLYLQGNPLRVTSSILSRSHQVILKFQDIDTPEAAQSLAGQWLTAPQETASLLSEGEYFHFQILGLRALGEDGEELGEITEIIETGSNDVYVISGQKGEILVPAIAQAVRQIDLDRGIMVVRLMEGLR